MRKLVLFLSMCALILMLAGCRTGRLASSANEHEDECADGTCAIPSGK